MTARALTLSELKRHLVDPPIPDVELTSLLNAALDAIDERVGPLGDGVEYRRASGRLLPLGRKATGIIKVVEHGREVDPSLYRLRPSGEILEKLSGIWRGIVEVTVDRPDDRSSRKRVAIGLVKLDLAYTPGVASETLGSFTESSSQQQGVTYAQLREEYLASLETNPAYVL